MLKPRSGMFIKHLKHRDIGYRIRHAFHETVSNKYIIKYEYWNLYGGVRPFPMGLSSQKFEITPTELDANWIEVHNV